MPPTEKQRAVRVTLTYLAYRPGVRSRLVDALELGVKAQNTEGDRTTGQDTKVWCWTHDREPKGCDDDGNLTATQRSACEVDVIQSPSDPTGEAAARPDRLRRMLAEVERAEQALLLACNTLAGHPLLSMADLAEVVAGHGESAHLAPVVRRCARTFTVALVETYGRTRPTEGHSADGEPGCGSCQRLKVKAQGKLVPWWNSPGYNAGAPTDLGGALDAPVRLCRACYRFAIEQDPVRLPTVKELRCKHDDPQGRWPKRYANAS